MDLSQLLEFVEGEGDHLADEPSPEFVKEIEAFQQSQASRDSNNSINSDSNPNNIIQLQAQQQTARSFNEAQLRLTPQPKPLQFRNGSIYIGELKDNIPHGQGCIYFKNSVSKYEGQFENGEKHGNGVYEYSNLVRYDGRWQRGKKHGPGQYIFDQKLIFQATFLDGDCLTGQLWKDGVLLSSGFAESVFQLILPNSSASSLRKLNFSIANPTLLELIYGQLSKLYQQVDKRGNLAAITDMEKFIVTNFHKTDTKKKWGFVYRVVRAGEGSSSAATYSSYLSFSSTASRSSRSSTTPSTSPSVPFPAPTIPQGISETGKIIGLLASSPTSKTPKNLPVSLLQETSQYQVMTTSLAWALFQVCKTYFEKRIFPRIICVDSDQVIGELTPVSSSSNQFILLEGYIPSSAIVSTHSFQASIPIIKKLTSIRPLNFSPWNSDATMNVRESISASAMNFGIFEDWQVVFQQTISKTEQKTILSGGKHTFLLQNAPTINFQTLNQQ